MTMAIDAAIRGVATVLREKVVPTLTDDFAVEVSRLSGIMLTIMANASDDAVALRVAENAKMRALFGDAASVVADAPLAAILTEASSSADPGLRISELDLETDRLRRIVVTVQVQLESQTDAAAKTLNQRIWRLLNDIEQSRAPRV